MYAGLERFTRAHDSSMREEDGFGCGKRIITWFSHGTYSTALGSNCYGFCPTGRLRGPIGVRPIFAARLGNKSGNKPMSRADSQQQGFLGTKMEQKWPLSCGFVLKPAPRRRNPDPDFEPRIRPNRACDLRFYGAPKGIRILIAYSS
jgi:hypothetical protein